VSTTSRIPVVIFFGGQSSEHEISCLTAQGVLGALDDNLFEAFGVGIAKDGRWVRYTPQQMMSLGSGDAGLPAVSGDGPEAVLTHDATNVYLASREGDRLVDTVEVDVALPLFHGPYGEDGTIQGFFEMIGLRYVGSGVTASAMGMDKQYMKVAFAAAGLPVAPYLVFRDETDDAISAAIEASPMTYPVYVKPARSGSSVGVSRVAGPNELSAALAEARRHDPKILVEQGIEGAREIECAVLGPVPGGSVRTSRPGEIIVHTADHFYDYRAKYLAADVAEVVVPADLDAETTARVQQIAAGAFAAIDAEGLARVDSFVLEDGSVVLIEINTMPGFTEISAFPQMWRADGLTYPTLITNLIAQALTRQFGVVR